MSVIIFDPKTGEEMIFNHGFDKMVEYKFDFAKLREIKENPNAQESTFTWQEPPLLSQGNRSPQGESLESAEIPRRN